MNSAVLVFIYSLSYIYNVQAQVTATIYPRENYNAPLDSERLVTFNCTVTARFLEWRVNDLVSGDPTILSRGVTTIEQVSQGNGAAFSSLSIPARQENDNTSIQCIGANVSPPAEVYSELVFLQIQGLLKAPPNLNLSEPGDQLTRTLTWDAPETLDLTDIEPDIEFYQVCYNLSSDDLTCVNVSSSERREFIFPNVCVPLIFTVTASNVVGEGNASEIVHSGSNTTCDKNTSVSSRGHNVSFLQPGNHPTVTLVITQNVPDPDETCVCIYEVQTSLNRSGSDTTSHGPKIPEIITRGEAITGLSLTVDSDLVANEIYSAIVAISSEGNSGVAVEFSTYDVQAVAISALPGGLELSCTFANGSQARSCILTVCGVENEVIDEESCVNITITRNGQALTSSTRHVVSLPGVYSIREVIEVESDGEMTTVRLIEDQRLANVTMLATTTAAETVSTPSTDGGGLSSRGGTNAGAIAAGVILGGVSILAIIVVAIIGLLILWRKKKMNKISREKSSRHLLGDSETDGGKVDTLNNKRESQMEATDPCYETVPNKPTEVSTTATNDQQEGVTPQNGDIQDGHIKSDSPTYPLYTEVMGKGKPQVKPQDDRPQEDRPDPPPKKLSVQEVRELNLATEEDIPDVPAQNLTEEDIRNLNLESTHSVQQEPVEVHTSQVQQVPGPIAAAGGDPLYAELEHKKSKPSVTVPDMTEVQYSQIKTDEIPPILPQKKKSRKNKEQSSPVIQRSETETASEPTVQTEKDITPTNIESGESQSQDQIWLDNVV